MTFSRPTTGSRFLQSNINSIRLISSTANWISPPQKLQTALCSPVPSSKLAWREKINRIWGKEETIFHHLAFIAKLIGYFAHQARPNPANRLDNFLLFNRDLTLAAERPAGANRQFCFHHNNQKLFLPQNQSPGVVALPPEGKPLLRRSSKQNRKWAKLSKLMIALSKESFDFF